jgi:hypothetical protein
LIWGWFGKMHSASEGARVWVPFVNAFRWPWYFKVMIGCNRLGWFARPQNLCCRYLVDMRYMYTSESNGNKSRITRPRPIPFRNCGQGYLIRFCTLNAPHHLGYSQDIESYIKIVTLILNSPGLSETFMRSRGFQSPALGILRHDLQVDFKEIALLITKSGVAMQV